MGAQKGFKMANTKPEKPIPPQIIVLDDLDFSWTIEEVEEVKKLWKDGVGIVDIAQQVRKKTPDFYRKEQDSIDETALLIMHLGRKRQVKPRKGGIFGSKESGNLASQRKVTSYKFDSGINFGPADPKELVNGPVRTTHLSQEEIAKKYGPPIPTKKTFIPDIRRKDREKLKVGDKVKLIRLPEGVRKSKKQLKIGDIGEVRNVYNYGRVYVWFEVGLTGTMSSLNLEVVKGGENRDET